MNVTCPRCRQPFGAGETAHWVHTVCPPQGIPTLNTMMYGSPDPVPDAFTVMQDEVAKIGEWPRSKQLQAARFLFNLGIRYDDCQDYLIRKQYKKESSST
jgi:hypothetical protein